MNCSECGNPLNPDVRNCPVCQTDCGFPNVRIAETEAETTALRQRYQDAIISSEARKCEDILKKFEEQIASSKAIICRNLALVHKLVSSDNELYVTYYNQIDSGSRLPEDNDYDFARSQVDQAIFPHFYQNIVFAVLSLNDKGLESFGEYHIILEENVIKKRASVFEENPFLFIKRHGIGIGDSTPPGYRATWEERAKLAVAKLHSKLDKHLEENDFPKILMPPIAKSKDDDYIEVHIFGPIHRRAIKKIVGSKPHKAERALLKSIKKKLSEFGATYEELR